MAGTTMASLPMIVLFLLTQRYFVQVWPPPNQVNGDRA